ncbi:MAG: class I SAM-dependent methyltransferase [Alphaproteobacteria bacterium]|nr:class I SAM-dependent methyltransferase [Alphaproteobacteria bacterium]MDX5415504.1 class I SAM-dependent methyltransferase [Alphaproteobacteria bacterium]MDX5492740.1 class I SAM-dependent methyltransferase [Alphaproteobacteria bacterium]
MTTDEKARQESYMWSRTTFHSEYNRYLAQFKVESCLENVRGNSLLDLACGDGLMTEMFARRMDRVVGVDANGKILAEARKRLPQVDFHESLVEDLELTEKFDTVTMLDLLEHVVDPIALLQKAASFLNDDGVLIIHVPNAQAINRRLAVLMGTLESCEELSPFDINVAGHRRSYSLPTLKRDIEAAGLKCASTGGIFYKILSTPQMDWFLKNGLWEEGGFGWGRVGAENAKDWREAFCRASYELGKQHPEDCNIIYACVTK